MQLDIKLVDTFVTGAILLAAIVGALLAASVPPVVGRAAAFGYAAIAATVGPVFTARLLGPGGSGVISLEAQVMLLAFGHTFALVLVLTLLTVTIRRVRRRGPQ